MELGSPYFVELGSPYFYAPTGAPNGIDYQLPNMQMWTDWRNKDGRRHVGPRNPYVHPAWDDSSPAALDFFSLADRFYDPSIPYPRDERRSDDWTTKMANNAHLEALWEHRGRMMPEEGVRQSQNALRPRGVFDAVPPDRAVLVAPPMVTNPPSEVSPRYTQEHDLLYGGPRVYQTFTDRLLTAAKDVGKVGQYMIDAGLAAADAQMRGDGRKKARKRSTVVRRMTQIKKRPRRHAKPLR